MNIHKLGIVLCLVIIVSAVALFEFTLNRSFIGSDDAYIHLRYIDNLRSGHGFGFNPDKPSNGSTSPLWVLIAAGLTREASDLPQAVKVLSISLFIISVFVFYVLSFRLLGSSLPAILATFIYASDPWLLKWAGSAMETSLVSLMVLLSIYFFLNSEKRRYLIAASLMLALATLARPENGLLFCFFLLIQITLRESVFRRVGRIAIALGVYFVVLVPWLVFALVTFGSPLPNTFAAKTIASGATVWGVGWYFLRVIGVTYWPWFLVLFGLILLSLKTIGRTRAIPLLKLQDKATVLLWLWCIIIPAFYTLSKLQTPSTRYLQITTPLLIAVGFYGLIRLASSVSWTKHRSRLTLIAVTVTIILYNVGLNGVIVLPSSRDFSEKILRTYQIVGEWLESNTPEDSRVAVAIDVGTIGYYSNREIIDLGGLNTTEVISYLPDSLSYVFVSKPDYLVITGESSEYALMNQTRFKEVAIPVASFPATPLV